MRFTHAALYFAVPLSLAAQQPERITLEGPEIAIYNLVGKLRVEGGSGDRVIVEVTRGGRDAGKLKLQTGDIRGRMALRVQYPEDHIYYSDMGWMGRSTFTISDDGTFSDSGHDRDRRRIEVSSRSGGLDAHADLRVMVPKGKRLFLRQGIGETTIDNVDGILDVAISASHTRVSRMRGSLSLDAGSGGVEVTDMTGDLRIDNGSGGTTLDGVRGGTLTMDVGSGSLRGRSIDVTEFVADVGSGAQEGPTPV